MRESTERPDAVTAPLNVEGLRDMVADFAEYLRERETPAMRAAQTIRDARRVEVHESPYVEDGQVIVMAEEPSAGDFPGRPCLVVACVGRISDARAMVQTLRPGDPQEVNP